jgi:3-methyladenine DNA glycosylase AlkC
MEPLKDMFNKAYYQELAIEFNRLAPQFNLEKFVREVTHDIEALSLNQRMRHTSVVLKKHLPDDFRKNIELMKRVIPQMRRGYTTLVFPDFTALYGLDDIDVSLEALAYFTTFGSSEFAVREFLKKDFKKTIKMMEGWAKDKNEHVRRLASEGSRPRLPWSFKLDEVIKNPSVTRKILEQLKTDETLYVRKSVANHLNDFSKDHPGYMLDLVSSWDLSNVHTAWIIKHACRGLIKKGHPAALKLFDFKQKVQVTVEGLKLNKKTLRLGDLLEFDFTVISTSGKTQKLAVDYRIHYARESGQASSKVFKLKEIDLAGKGSLHIHKKQVFKDFTTRKHHAGKHVLEVIINGNILAKAEFQLKV